MPRLLPPVSVVMTCCVTSVATRCSLAGCGKHRERRTENHQTGGRHGTQSDQHSERASTERRRDDPNSSARGRQASRWTKPGHDQGRAGGGRTVSSASTPVCSSAPAALLACIRTARIAFAIRLSCRRSVTGFSRSITCGKFACVQCSAVHGKAAGQGCRG